MHQSRINQTRELTSPLQMLLSGDGIFMSLNGSMRAAREAWKFLLLRNFGKPFFTLFCFVDLFVCLFVCLFWFLVLGFFGGRECAVGNSEPQLNENDQLE